MKTLMIFILGLVSLTAFADFGGDILCVKKLGNELVADAKGRISVKLNSQGEAVAKTKLQVRLFSGYGKTRGTVIESLLSSGISNDGNDYFGTQQTPNQPNSKIKTIELDLSSMNAGTSKVITQKGNEYLMNCVLRED